MHCLLLPIVIVALAAVPSWAADTQTNPADVKAVLNAEEQMAEAGRRYDVKALGALMMDDYIGISVSGTTRDKATLLQATESAPAAVKEKNSQMVTASQDVKIRFYGPVAIVTGQVDIPGPNGFGTRFTRVWVKSDGGWKLSTAHITRIGQPSSATVPANRDVLPKQPK